jgi:hypothetical protein
LLFDFIAHSLSLSRLVVTVFLCHHLAAALTAYCSLELGMCHYYANFFGGCSELSTLFLVFCDLDVYFPAAMNHGASSIWPTFILLCQGGFVITFLAYRVVGWWMVSAQLWSDAFVVLKGPNKDKDEDKTPAYGKSKLLFLYMFLAMDVALGLLQVYWFVYGMLPKIVEIINQR